MIYDVVIAGGGPVGLFLACELGLAGIKTVVLERMEDPRSPLKAGWMGMRGLNFPSVEAFYRRGMLKDVRASSLAWMDTSEKPGMELGRANASGSPSAPRFAGHFAGIMLDASKIDFSSRKYLVQGPSSSGGIVNLEGIELLLAERAEKLGVELRRGMEVTDFSQDDDIVTVCVGSESFQTRWLIGCDGGRSAVRKLAGFEFPGTDPEFTGYSASVEIADPEKLKSGFNLTASGMYTYGLGGLGPGRIGVIDFDDATFDRSQTITLEGLQEILRRVSGTDVTLKALHVATSYTDRARQAITYRRGRVLLAGDAAHIHSPLGGQGLNTGLGDAMNLGWKLAATIQGWAPEGLLDTYTEERHPVGAWALDWTRAQVAIMRPDHTPTPSWALFAISSTHARVPPILPRESPVFRCNTIFPEIIRSSAAVRRTLNLKTGPGSARSSMMEPACCSTSTPTNRFIPWVKTGVESCSTLHAKPRTAWALPLCLYDPMVLLRGFLKAIPI